ncbi:hypothetical protein PFISCL1PPCAC_5987, partial [Pristionchus fissidentatus]
MVEITFKTLSQESFKLELQLSDKISDVKAKIAESRGDAVELQKLLYNGKILGDDSTVEQCGLDPARFVVVMVTKAPAAAPAQPAPETAAPAAPAPAAPSAAPSAPAAAPALTAEQESAVQAILSMGFGREGAIAALQAANFNADAAVDFLMGGEDMGGAPAAAAAGAGRGGRAPDLAPGMIEAASGRRENPGIGLLRGMPQFDEIRRLVRENPQLLPELLAQVGQVNPELMQIIQQDPAAFAAILNEELLGGDSDEDDDDDEMNYEPDEIGGGNAEEDLRNRGVARIQVTPDENAAIERLKSMGFPEALVVEAFFACDKNEDLAVNYILQRMDEAAVSF